MYTAMESLTVDRVVARLGWSRSRIMLVIGLVLLLIPIAVAYHDLGMEAFSVLVHREGRHLFFYPTMIIFLLSIMGPVQRTREGVARAVRPLTPVDDAEFAAVTVRACALHPARELMAFGAGVLFFLWLEGRYTPYPEYAWGSVYAYVAALVMFGVIGWSIYGSFMITQLTNQLLQLPVQIDIFDSDALVPIGRQSLYLALTFVGASLLSLLFVVPADELRNFFSPDNIIIYSILIVLTFAVFFLNMHRAHGLLTAAKKVQLRRTDQNLARAYYQLQATIERSQDTSTIATELNALAASKQELLLTRTWPYDTAMLRTLFFSVVTPLIVGLSRVLLPLFLGT